MDIKNNLAIITITYNDDFKFQEWIKWYDEYKDSCYLHIIVDNGSALEYQELVKKTFKNSVVLELGHNGGCTEAYNHGIKYALRDENVQAIMLLGNDIQVKDGSLDAMFNFLQRNSEIGMVGGCVYRKGTNIIECYGDTINCLGISKSNYRNGHIEDVPDILEVSFVGGGANMSSRRFYEVVGLQDENLFMYNDEMDMFYRAKRCGFKEAVIKEAQFWHQHISPVTSSIQYACNMAYLNGRNRVYIIKKHMPLAKGLCMFIYMQILETIFFFRDIRDIKSRKAYFSKWRGFIAGLKGNMNNDFVKAL